MAKKPIRSYYSLVRSKQADETRARIAAAARKLILCRGFEAATVEAIAQGAGVAVPTVYAVFGSKCRILAELVDRAAFGPVFQKLIGEAERLTTRSPACVSPPASRARFTTASARSRSCCARRASSCRKWRPASMIANAGATRRRRSTIAISSSPAQLNPALTENEARDIQWTFTARDLYRLLVVERGWSADRYEQWLADAMVATLVVPKRQRRKRRRVGGRRAQKPDDPIRLCSSAPDAKLFG